MEQQRLNFHNRDSKAKEIRLWHLEFYYQLSDALSQRKSTNRQGWWSSKKSEEWDPWNIIKLIDKQNESHIQSSKWNSHKCTWVFSTDKRPSEQQKKSILMPLLDDAWILTVGGCNQTYGYIPDTYLVNWRTMDMCPFKPVPKLTTTNIMTSK